MQKLKDRGNSAVPPKKSASAYIIFGKEVSAFLITVEKIGNFKEESKRESDGSSEGDCLMLGLNEQGREAEVQGPSQKG